MDLQSDTLPTALDGPVVTFLSFNHCHIIDSVFCLVLKFYTYPFITWTFFWENLILLDKNNKGKDRSNGESMQSDLCLSLFDYMFVNWLY